MKRHPSLSVRQSEKTSIARAKGFNRDAVNIFLDILEDNMKMYKIDAYRIYNVDETGFSTVQKKCSKRIDQRGKKTIEQLVAKGEPTPPLYVA